MYDGQYAQLQANIRKVMFADFPNMHYANPMSHFVVDEDFANFTGAVGALVMPGWAANWAVSGACTIPDGLGGTLSIDSGAATVTQGINLQKIGECFLPAANKDIWYEVRIQVSHTGCEFFAGLAATDNTIIAASAMNVTNYIGWHSTSDDGVLLFSSDRAAATSALNAAYAYTAAQYFTLGFYVEGLTAIHQYVNDTYVNSIYTPLTIPITELTPSFVCQSDGADQPIMLVDYVRVVQLR